MLDHNSSRAATNQKQRDSAALSSNLASAAFGTGPTAKISLSNSRRPGFQQGLQTELNKRNCGAAFAAELLIKHLTAEETRQACDALGNRVLTSVPLYEVQIAAWDRVYRLFVHSMLRRHENEAGELPALLGRLPGEDGDRVGEPNSMFCSRSRSKRPLNKRQLEFLHLYFDGASPAFGNRALAAALAGYKRGKAASNQLDVQAHRILHHPDFQEAVLIELLKRGCGTALLAAVLDRHARATKFKVVVNEEGEPEVMNVPLYKVQVRAYDRLQIIFGNADTSSDDVSGITPGNPYTEESPTERMYYRSIIEKMMTLSQLDAAAAENERKPHIEN